MVKNIALNRFVIGPDLVFAKDVDLDRQPLWGGGQLPYEKGHFLTDLRVVFQIGFYIGAEGADIGHAPAIGQVREIDLVEFVVFGQFLFFTFNMIGDILDFAKTLDHLLVQEFDGADIDIYRTLDPAAARILHPAPVFERFADQGIGGDGGDGLIPVLHLDRRQRHVEHIAVGAVFGHFDPVAARDHAVDRKLDAGD